MHDNDWLVIFSDSSSYRSVIYILTLNGHIKTAEQRTIIQQYCDWYTGR